MKNVYFPFFFLSLDIDWKKEKEKENDKKWVKYAPIDWDTI